MWRNWLASARSDDDEETPEAQQGRLRRRRRWTLVIAGAVVLLLAAGFLIQHFGGSWLERRTRDHVHEYLEQQDYRRVQLTLEQAVQVSPHSLTARRSLAEFYEAAGSPLAADRWREVVALVPDDDEVRLRLSSVVLRAEGPAAARAALEGVSAAGKATLAYHRVAAGIALSEGRTAELQAQLAAMAALEPENIATKISLASLELRSPAPAVATAARDELERIAGGENLRIRATLSLLLALPRSETDAPVRELAARILSHGTLAVGMPAGVALIEHMKAEPHPSAEDAAALAGWMVAHGGPREALVWLAAQGPATLKAPAVLAVRADAATQLRDWNLLRQLISDGAWGRVTRDGIELAFAARLQRERAGVARARETFADAIEVASPSLPTLNALDRLCGLWGWPEDSERVLTRIARDFPREQSAWLGLLAKAEAAEKSTRYWEIARKRSEVFPDDPAAQALRTYAAVITGQNDAPARKAALAALASDDARPEELAAGLLLRWREKSAAEALAGLSPRQVDALSRDPRGALVYGAALAAAGRDATEILARARSGRLLPEERALLPRRASNGAVAPAIPDPR